MVYDEVPRKIPEPINNEAKKRLTIFANLLLPVPTVVLALQQLYANRQIKE